MAVLTTILANCSQTQACCLQSTLVSDTHSVPTNSGRHAALFMLQTHLGAPGPRRSRGTPPSWVGSLGLVPSEACHHTVHSSAAAVHGSALMKWSTSSLYPGLLPENACLSAHLQLFWYNTAVHSLRRRTFCKDKVYVMYLTSLNCANHTIFNIN